jgi:cytochrome c-type biogenesis protein CcmF
VHAFAVDPTRGVLLLIILGAASGAGFALFAWRAPALGPGGVFAPVSRESALVLNNVLLAAAAATVLLGTLYPLIREAMSGAAMSVGPPYFNLTFLPLMAALAILLPAGPLLAWKRGDAAGVAQRLWAAALIALAAGLMAFMIASPRQALGAAGVAFGIWLIAGAVAELAERARAFRVPMAESWRRLGGLPRGAWGMTLAHAGLGLFVLGAAFETAWKVEAAEALPAGGSLDVGAYHLTLERVAEVEGPNYEAERGVIRAVRRGRLACAPEPERRLYVVGGQSTSEVAICRQGISHLYVVMGERRDGPGGKPVWLVRAYWNPWAVLIFAGPVLMALGGLASLSDRRLRLGVARRAAAAPPRPDVAPQPLEAEG